MLNTILPLLQAGSGAAPAGGMGGGSSMLIFLLLMILIFYFFMIRPQQKKQKEIQNFRNSITRGQQIVTAGGIYGTVKSIDLAKNTVDIKIARDVVVTVEKTSVYKDMASTQQGK